MFRFAVVVLAVIGLVSLFFGSVSGAAAGAGFLLLIPLLFVAKILFFVMLVGFIGRGFARSGPSRYRRPWDRREGPMRSDAPKRSREADFEEWHRMAHAREEVDSWIPEIE